MPPARVGVTHVTYHVTVTDDQQQIRPWQCFAAAARKSYPTEHPLTSIGSHDRLDALCRHRRAAAPTRRWPQGSPVHDIHPDPSLCRIPAIYVNPGWLLATPATPPGATTSHQLPVRNDASASSINADWSGQLSDFHSRRPDNW